MIAKRKRFFGKWASADGVSSVVYEVINSKRGVSIRAVDKDDGEKLVVSRARWLHDCLEFETFVRSTGFRAKHRFVSISRNRIKQELTTIEYWRRET